MRADHIIREIQRVQREDQLGRRALLQALIPVLERMSPPMASAVRAGLEEIPENPGYGLEGAMCNRAEEHLLDAVQFGLQRPWSGPDGPQPRLMMWRLLRLGRDNVDPYTRDWNTLRAGAVLGWRLLQAVVPLVNDVRKAQIYESWMRPPTEPAYGSDLQAAKKNRGAFDTVFDTERLFEPPGTDMNLMGRRL